MTNENIATIQIADAVERHMLDVYYQIQLEALQDEAKRLGYYFAKADTAAVMPPLLADCLAESLQYRREIFLYPKRTPEYWERWTRNSMSDGYAQQHMQAMIEALATLGLRLQESPEAVNLLTIEECRLRERDAMHHEETATAQSLDDYGFPSLDDYVSDLLDQRWGTDKQEGAPR